MIIIIIVISIPPLTLSLVHLSVYVSIFIQTKPDSFLSHPNHINFIHTFFIIAILYIFLPYPTYFICISKTGIFISFGSHSSISHYLPTIGLLIEFYTDMISYQIYLYLPSFNIYLCRTIHLLSVISPLLLPHLTSYLPYFANS